MKIHFITEAPTQEQLKSVLLNMAVTDTYLSIEIDLENKVLTLKDRSFIPVGEGSYMKELMQPTFVLCFAMGHGPGYIPIANVAVDSLIEVVNDLQSMLGDTSSLITVKTQREVFSDADTGAPIAVRLSSVTVPVSMLGITVYDAENMVGSWGGVPEDEEPRIQTHLDFSKDPRDKTL